MRGRGMIVDQCRQSMTVRQKQEKYGTRKQGQQDDALDEVTSSIPVPRGQEERIEWSGQVWSRRKSQPQSRSRPNKGGGAHSNHSALVVP